MFHIADNSDIKKGKLTDIYFERTEKILSVNFNSWNFKREEEKESYGHKIIFNQAWSNIMEYGGKISGRNRYRANLFGYPPGKTCS